MLFENLKKDIQTNKIAPVWLLHGDEPYFLDQLVQLIEEKVIPATEKNFNQFVVFGKDQTIASILGLAKRFPMMAERQLVLVKEAQDIAGLDSKEQANFLENYVLNPLPSTVLVLCCKTPIDERKAWVKAFHTKGVVFASKKMYESKVPDWIASYCHNKGVKISHKAIQMLVEFVGADLKQLVAEIEKILLNIQVHEEINADRVEKFVGIRKEYNNFELQKAILKRDILKANTIATVFAANSKDNPIQPSISILFNYFSKLLLAHSSPDKSEKNLATLLEVNPFFVKDYLLGIRHFGFDKTVAIIGYLRQADAHSKGIDTVARTDSDILKELIYKILH